MKGSQWKVSKAIGTVCKVHWHFHLFKNATTNLESYLAAYLHRLPMAVVLSLVYSSSQMSSLS